MTGSAPWRKNVFWLWFTQTLAIMGMSGVMPFIPIYIRDAFGIADETSRGFFVACFTFAGLFGLTASAPLWGMLGDRYGRKLMLLRAYLGLGLTIPLMLLAPNVWMLILIRLFSSFFAGTVTAAQALAVTCTPDDRHGLALGTLSAAMWGGNMAGYFFGGIVVERIGYFWTFNGCGGLMMLSALCSFAFIREDFVPPQGGPVAKKRRFDAWRGLEPAIWVICAIMFLIAVARRTDGPYLAMLVEIVNGTTVRAAHDTGIVSGISSLGGILAGMVCGALCDRFSPRKVAVPLILLAAAAGAAQATAAHIAVLSAARFLLFFAAGGLEPVFLAKLAHLTKPERRGTVFGLNASLRNFGVLTATLLSGGVICLVGTRGVFLIGALLFPLVFPLMFLLARLESRGGAASSGGRR